MQITNFTETTIHDREKFPNKRTGVAARLIFIFFSLTTIPAYSGEWRTLSHGENENFLYETYLIEQSGLFSKEYSAWLKIKRIENKTTCREISNPPKNNKSAYDERRAQIEDLITKNTCTQAVMRVPMEELHKVSIKCKSKTTSHINYESTNLRGEWVSPTYRIGSHPGSLGYAVMSFYCEG